MSRILQDRTEPATTVRTTAEATPPRPTPPLELRAPTRRRAGVIALALALIAAGGATGAWLLTRSTQYVDVLVVANPVQRGELVQAEDLSTTALPEATMNLDPVPAGDLELVVGQYATTDLPAGGILTPSAVTTGLSPAPGTSVVGVALTPAQRPAQSLPAGQRVRFVATPSPGGDPPTTDPDVIDASVLGTVETDSGDLIVNVEVPQSEAAALAALAATTRIAMVLDGAGE